MNPSPLPGSAPRVQLLTKHGCHLCADARLVVAQVTQRLGLSWEDVDTDAAPELAERYAEEIPVLMIDGVQRDFWRIDPARLERLLTA
ncbi:glutaredoxin family protein [Galactobacter caseinivorans]|uniref:Glutaredoxin family protein n=1 Tax=Galactobacter caseinivorans TaxID=2676123 RepID=A0A496PLM5_9MICC|nr:glutaredoxin family protein [Galactobacter caseinivorans]RKW71344.1 glutaredoxin family protein [Galactobacter caseinivorans]